MKISNKAIVGVAGVLAIFGAVLVTGSGECLWALVLLAWLLDSVKDNENN